MKLGKSLNLLFGAFLCCGVGTAQAVTLDIIPSSQSVSLGSSVEVGVGISGFGVGVAPSLGVFDLDLIFDPAILSLTGVVYGDPFLGDQLDLFGFGSFISTTPGAGMVNLFELSFDFPSDLDDLQAAAFTLVSLTFSADANGISSLGITVNELGDSLGDPLFAQVGSGSVSVGSTNPVPEPSTIFLLGSGLLGMVGIRQWKNKAVVSNS